MDNIINIIYIFADASKNSSIEAIDLKHIQWIKDAIKTTKSENIKLYVFNYETLEYSVNKQRILLTDKNVKFKFYNENINNSIVIFSHSLTIAVKHLNTDKLLSINMLNLELSKFNVCVFNNITYGKDSGNKYSVYNKIKKDCPNVLQPKTVLITPDYFDEDANQKTIDEKLKEVYGKISDKNEYVVKILNGFGGNGVFMCNHKNILSILQALGKIAPNTPFIVQDKKDIKENGDVRVHVITLGDKQFIWCALSIKKHEDFRCNTNYAQNKVIKVKLTKEQEQMCLDVAKSSGLCWVGIDLMCTTDGKTYLCEYNSCAGWIQMYNDSNDENLWIDFIEKLNEVYK